MITKKIGHITDETLEALRPELKAINRTSKFGREVAHIGPDYPYSGIVVPGQDWSLFPAIKDLMDKVNETLGLDFNSCLINFYPKGKACGIGRHKDIEPCLENIGVVSVSLGLDSDSEFIFRDMSGDVVKNFTLRHRDVFFFTAEDNLTYTHEIPKRVYPYGRISLTFRKFKFS